MSETVIGKLSATESKFTWEVPNFSMIEADWGTPVYSPTFCMPFHSDEFSTKIKTLHWRIRLYPNGGYNDSSQNNYVSVCLENLDEIHISTAFTISFTKGGVVRPKRFKEFSFGEKTFWGWPNFAKKELVINECLENDTLPISCRIYSTKIICNDDELDQEDFSVTLLNHYDMLFETGKFCDVTIKIGNENLMAHKTVLTCSSPVLRAMFESQMKEQNENVVEIVDIEFDVMKEMLRYMYVRKVNEIEKIASDLFVAADKYRVDGLKRLCENTLCKGFDMDNALERLEMAVQYNMKKLKRNANKFIVGHLKSFNAKEEFKELSSDCKSELFGFIAETLGDKSI